MRPWLASACVPLLAAVLATSAAGRDNVLLIIGDDMGVDVVGAYQEQPDACPTPVLDLLARRGVLFRNVWSNPVCSPTRMSMLTGRYGFRTGIGISVQWAGSNGPFEPLPEEVTLPEALAATHRTAAVGKWHLATKDGFGYQHPIDFGFERFVGTRANLGGSEASGTKYYIWEKNVADAGGNTQFTERGYATTVNVDDALEAIADFGDEPWFMWLAFNAPHTPFHVPPAELTTMAVDESSDDRTKFCATVEALDTEIGRLLTSIRPAVLERTWVIFIGDNGTSGQVVDTPNNKGTVYEGGVNVPLIVFGPVVDPGREVAALVNASDLFATVLELADVPVPATAVDSVSLAPYLMNERAPSIRRWVYTEKFTPNGFGPYEQRRRAIRDGRYKLIDSLQPFPGIPFPPPEFYDLEADPDETNSLSLEEMTPAQRKAFGGLRKLLLTLTGTP